jgi:hypothetical protein
MKSKKQDIQFEVELDELKFHVVRLKATEDFLQGMVVGVSGGSSSHNMYLYKYLDAVQLARHFFEEQIKNKLAARRQ